ncbi:ribonuclease H-like domain-containing protein [Tanacetum coccineum]|uniref:Ribonuclease H-like domain-containing protein n=1 Tax=Tanacetum coccineum TaxID=301880 RepID=A0ABQ4Z994_9ASTR
MGLLIMDDGIVNWGEHTEDEEINHALMAINSSSEVIKKHKYWPIVKLQMKYMKKDEKLKKYRRIRMKAVKEKEQLQKTLDSWKDSSKNLWRLINSGMSSSSKIGLGYEIKSNNEVLRYEEEMNFFVFNCIEEDSVGKPLYSRFIKSNDFKEVPHPLSGDYTPQPQEEIDESLYVYGSLSHLIKDCDYYEKKMAREAEFKKQRVFNTGNRVAKPVWTNADRINRANQFVPRPVQVNAGRPNINSVRPNINTGRTNINSVRPRVNTVSSNFNIVRSRQPVPTRTSNNFSPKRPQDHPLKNMVDRGSKGYITGKGRIRVGNLDFDSVSFVKELGYFNLLSISQICDKQHKVLFTETECLVVSSNFKMPDENQILLKVPRHHNMYSFDMKTPTPLKGFACLIAKATSDESKMWHRRLGHINLKCLNKLVKGNLVRATKSPSIANYKIIKQGRKGVYHIVRENGTDRVYISFGAMLTDISRYDLTKLYRIVMKKHGMNEPEDEFEKVLWEYLKNMFEEPLSTDSIWSLLGQQRIICWRYYDACKVHCLNLESADVYMLIERKYPLSAEVCKAMLDKKLQGGKPDEDCYKLLKMMEKQAGIRK